MHSAGIQREMFWKIIQITLFIPIALHSFPAFSLAARLKTNKPNFTKVKDPGCPLEHFYGIRVSNSKDSYAVGEEIQFKCLVSPESDAYFRFINYEEEFFVFPNPTRRCLQDYTWSGAPPICVWKQRIIQEELNQQERFKSGSVAKPYKATYCADRHNCVKGSEFWTTVGVLRSTNYSTRSRSTNYSTRSSRENFETQIVRFSFSRYFHLAFLSFMLPNSENFSVEVKARPQDVIGTLSADSSSLLVSYNETTEEADRRQGKRNTILLGIYSRQLIIEFSTEIKNATSSPKRFKYGWNPKPFFYTIPGLDFERKRGLVGTSCPEKPTIPNAALLSTANTSVLRYACNPGYKMYDPITKRPSDGLVICSEDLIWFPYPFPVCYPLIRTELLLPNKHIIRNSKASKKVVSDSNDESTMTTSLGSRYPRPQTVLTKNKLKHPRRKMVKKPTNETIPVRKNSHRNDS